MDKKAKNVLVGLLAAAGILIIVLAISYAAPKAKPQCSDGIDNDGDTYKDYPSDPGCSSKNDVSELNSAVECDNGADNDGDGQIDYPDDAGCTGPTDNDESNCGDSACEGGETCTSCQADCGICNSCSDTDGGNVPLVQGTVSGYLNGQQYSNTDTCLTNSTLQEYMCGGALSYSTNMNCVGNMTTVCTNGACI